MFGYTVKACSECPEPLASGGTDAVCVCSASRGTMAGLSWDMDAAVGPVLCVVQVTVNKAVFLHPV